LAKIEMSASKEWCELRDAVWQKDFDAAQRLITLYPSLPRAKNGIGESVLHFLAVENDEVGVSWLSARGFGLDTKNEFGTPVIFEVAQLRYGALLRWFIKSGVDMSATDREGRDIRAYLIEYDRPDVVSILDALNQINGPNAGGPR